MDRLTHWRGPAAGSDLDLPVGGTRAIAVGGQRRLGGFVSFATAAGTVDVVADVGLRSWAGMARFPAVPRIRYFAQAREAAGTAVEEVAGATVGDVLAAAVVRHGARLEAVLAICAVWLDGEPCTSQDPVALDGEVAVLPPVSGGFSH